jgi:hypothetical protein
MPRERSDVNRRTPPAVMFWEAEEGAQFIASLLEDVLVPLLLVRSRSARPGFLFVPSFCLHPRNKPQLTIPKTIAEEGMKSLGCRFPFPILSDFYKLPNVSPSKARSEREGAIRRSTRRTYRQKSRAAKRPRWAKPRALSSACGSAALLAALGSRVAGGPSPLC